MQYPTSPQSSFYSSGYDRERSIVSPSKMRINQLSERLANMQLDLDQEKQIKREVYENKIKNLQEKVNTNQTTDEAKFKLLAEQSLKIADEINTHKLGRESLTEKKGKEQKQLDTNFFNELTMEKQSRKESETRVLKQVDERVYHQKVELAKDKKNREELEERSAQEFGEEIVGLQDEIEEERKIREEGDQRLIKRLGEEILKFQEILQSEKKQREEAQSSMFKMLEEMNNKLQNDINQEQQNRDYSEANLLRLLEDTCSRLESNVRL